MSEMLLRVASRSSSRENDEQSPANNVTKLEQDFDLGESLGQGGYGQIVKANRKCDNNEFAIKIIRFKSNLEDVETNRREATFLSKLNHNNIVRYFSSWIETAQISRAEYDKLQSESEESLVSEIRTLSLNNNCRLSSDDDDYENETEDEENNETSESDNWIIFVPDRGECVEIKYLCIQMELCEKRTLRTVIDKNLYLEENKLTKYFKEICEGLSYIHSSNIVHRDLNPKNIFLAANDVIKIGDFGLSKQIENNFETILLDELPYASCSAPCGTRFYTAPEILNRSPFNIKADIYSLGVTYFEMCSKPMTDHEKYDTFPITIARLRTISFVQNTFNKKCLLKSLLQENHKERPTCSEILKILNSGASFAEFRNLIQQDRKVSLEEWAHFERTLKSISYEKDKLTHTFLTTAQKIFEQHGGQNLAMPTFIPAFGNHSDHLTTLVSTTGNFSAVSNTSRIAFSYYLDSNKINKIRRYSIGKVFKEGFHSPSEDHECIFQAVSPEVDDHVTDAEMMYIGEKICNEMYLNSKEICFVLNYGQIFWSILKHCKIDRKRASVFINNKITTEMLRGLELSKEVESFLLKMTETYSIEAAHKLIKQAVKNNKNQTFGPVSMNGLLKGFRNLNVIVENAKKFGVKAEIFVSPLLLNQGHSSGFMFKMLDRSQLRLLATGGRFHSLIKSCRRTKKGKRVNIAAVDISFNVNTVIESLSPGDTTSRNIDVVVVARNKAAAIPLYKFLLSKQIKCEIVKELIVTESTQGPLVVIHLEDEHSCTVYRRAGERSFTSSWIFNGNWKTSLFSAILSSALSKSLFNYVPQIAY